MIVLFFIPLDHGYDILDELDRFSTCGIRASWLSISRIVQGNMEMEPAIENMTISKYIEYEAAKERRLWDDVRSRRSPINYNKDDDSKEDQEEDGDDGDTFDMWDITVEDAEWIRQLFNVPDEIDEIVQPLILELIHSTPPNDDYVASATKLILDELLEVFGDEILNVTMVNEEANFNPTKDLEELERLLAKEPQSNFMEIQFAYKPTIARITNVKANKLLMSVQAPFLNVQMMSVHISSGLVLHQMTSDHNRSELGIQDHSNEQSKHPSDTNVFTMKMEILLEPASNKLLVGDDADDKDESSDDDEDDDVDIEEDEEEEEHLAPADSTAVALPAVDHAPSAEETEPFETDESAATPPPHPAYRVARLLVIPTPPPSPLSLWSSPLPQIPSPPLPLILSPLPVSSPPPASPTYPLGYRAAMIRLRAEAPSTSHSPPPHIILSHTRADTPPSGTPPLLPIPLPTSSPSLLLPFVDHGADRPEFCLPPLESLVFLHWS
ncbi:hypothetical protein Tco_0992409 [Tanacetum coccineum]|uniref:Uncharacterized protein n=1 Tax=Tanacetum coccineum TaxID=301880 RepID=A0ABQ5F280_9ASTR